MNKPASPPPGDDLDFSGPCSTPAPAITPQQAEHVRKEAVKGGRQLEDSGYFVSITHHPEARIAPRNGNKYVILAVEDDSDLGQLLIDIFTLSGFEVRWASNRAEINAELNRKPEADLVLMDIMLPDANGLEVLRRLRSHPRLATLPVIMMTGKSGPEDVLAGLAAGADGYVSKPFKMSGLVKAVNIVLGNV